MKVDHFATETSSNIEGKRKNMLVYNYYNPEPLYIDDKGKQKKIGDLKKGDLVYKVNESENAGKKVIDFMVVKFADTDNHFLTFKSDRPDDFIEYKGEEKTLPNVDENGNLPSDKKMRGNLAIPVIVGIGGGVIGYYFSQRAQAKPLGYVLGGIALFAGIGYLVTQMGTKPKITEDKPIDTTGSVINIPEPKK